MPPDGPPSASGGGPDSTQPISSGFVRRARDEQAPRVAVVVEAQGGLRVAFLQPGVPLVVGRDRPAGLRIHEDTLSRKHARFSLLEGARVLVEDLRSTNGTWRHGEQIRQAELEPGDSLQLGALRASIQAFGESAAHAVPPAPSGDDEPIAGKAMKEVLAMVTRAAAVRLSVILHGETGTGKEVLASMLHARGPRRAQPMICMNCGSIPVTLVESVLFGYEKGSFTGADQRKIGMFEEANHGTLFLDEVGELPPSPQAALLRVLETGRLRRVGAAREIAVDVRIVAATHRDLKAMVREGRFRQDLYQRLAGMVIEVPPLRERTDEIEPLCRRFLREANAANKRKVRGIGEEAMELLLRYSWPGNVRELKLAIEYAVALADAREIRPEHLPEAVRTGSTSLRPPPASVPAPLPPGGDGPSAGGGSFKNQIKALEERLIRDALQRTGWNKAKAARELGIPLRTLANKIKALGLEETGQGG